LSEVDYGSEAVEGHVRFSLFCLKKDAEVKEIVGSSQAEVIVERGGCKDTEEEIVYSKKNMAESVAEIEEVNGVNCGRESKRKVSYRVRVEKMKQETAAFKKIRRRSFRKGVP